MRRCRARRRSQARPSGSPCRAPRRGYAGTTRRRGESSYERLFGGHVLRSAEHARRPAVRGRAPRLRHVGRACLRALRRPAAGLTRLHELQPTSRHRWQSRENGVFSTDDGGKTWRRIYPTYAQRVLRLSATRGVISVTAIRPATAGSGNSGPTTAGEAGTRRTRSRPRSRAAAPTVFSWSGRRVQARVLAAAPFASVRLVPGGCSPTPPPYRRASRCS